MLKLIIYEAPCRFRRPLSQVTGVSSLRHLAAYTSRRPSTDARFYQSKYSTVVNHSSSDFYRLINPRGMDGLIYRARPGESNSVPPGTWCKKSDGVRPYPFSHTDRVHIITVEFYYTSSIQPWSASNRDWRLISWYQMSKKIPNAKVYFLRRRWG